MLVLLPPSESKRPAPGGAPVDLASLAHPELAPDRKRVGDALVKVSGQRNARAALGVGASLADEVARNLSLWSAPAAPAAHVYSGVLYEAAGAATWDHAELARAGERVRIISALWGALSPADAIPAYRLSMGTTLGRLGPLAAFWRPRLAPVLDTLADGGLVVDCRSAPYAAAWRGRNARVVAVRVVRDAGGNRAVVSHMAKHTRGLLAARLVALESPPETLADLADAATGLADAGIIDISVSPDARGGGELTLAIAG